jgi:hypothetical protein
MYNNILTLQRIAPVTCAWVRTGNPRSPLACEWVETNARSNAKEASSSNEESGRLPLCA